MLPVLINTLGHLAHSMSEELMTTMRILLITLLPNAGLETIFTCRIMNKVMLGHGAETQRLKENGFSHQLEMVDLI